MFLTLYCFDTYIAAALVTMVVASATRPTLNNQRGDSLRTQM